MAAIAATACGPAPPPPPPPLAVRGAARSGTPLHVVCVAAHPDGAESGCGGTLARYAEAGHDVHVLYVTRGEMGIEGKSPEEAAAIRTAEAEEACRALGVKAHYFDHPAGPSLVFSQKAAGEL